MADPERTMLDRADVGPVVAPAAHTHGKGEIGSHADAHAEGGSDPVSPESIGAARAGGVTYGAHADDAPDGTYWISGGTPITPTNGYPDGLSTPVATLTTHSALGEEYRVQTLVTDEGQEWRRLKRGSWLAWETSAPTTHASQHAEGGADWITPESIGALNRVSDQLPDGTDLNTVTAPGLYLSNSSTNPNMPESTHGHLEVFDRPQGSFLIQRFTTHYRTNHSRIWVRTLQVISGEGWTPWVRVDAGAVTPASIGAEPTIRDTGWRRLLSWRDGVQDTTGQVGTLNTNAYTLIGRGYLDIRRRGDYVMFRSEYAISGGGAIRSTTTTPRALFNNFVLPGNYRVNFGDQWGIMMPIGYRGEERLLIGSPGDQQSFGFCTPDGSVDIRGIAGGYPTTYPFPTEPYIGTPA